MKKLFQEATNENGATYVEDRNGNAYMEVPVFSPSDIFNKVTVARTAYKGGKFNLDPNGFDIGPTPGPNAETLVAVKGKDSGTVYAALPQQGAPAECWHNNMALKHYIKKDIEKIYALGAQR